MEEQRTKKSRVLTRTVFVQMDEIQRQNIFAGHFLKSFSKCDFLLSTKSNFELDMKFLVLKKNIYLGVFQV